MQSQTIDRYHILGRIASGGQGAIYRAWDPSNGQVVALKTLLPGGAANSDGIERFRREAELTAEVDHPNVIRILDNGRDQDSHFIVMEFLPISVADLIRSVGQLPIGRTVDICRQVALGLEAANDHGIIHRDIKPSNLLIAPDGAVKVTDFGLARSSNLPTMTSPGAVMGTASYMSPEQVRGHRVDTRTDIYSLGVVLYEMLTGSAPFDAETGYAIMRKHVEERPESVSQRRPGVPIALDSIVNTCLAKKREDRFQTLGHLAAALNRLWTWDQVTLIELYEATDGPNWSNNTHWLSDIPVSQWHCVTVDSNGNVTQLALRDNNLTGKIPSGLARLDNLTHLDLGENYLSGQIPPELGRLSNLQELRLDNNYDLAGRLPGELGGLTNLRRLHLVSSPIIGTLPPELGNLTSLEDLTIADSMMSGEIPRELCNLVKLKDLYLLDNNFSGKIPSELCNLTSLEELHLAGNKWAGCIPAGLRNVPVNDLPEIGLPFCDT